MTSTVMQPQPASEPPPPAEIEKAVEEVFLRPEFAKDPLSDWLGQAIDWLWDQLSSLAGWAEANPTGRWVLIVVLSLILVALLAHIAWTIWRILPQRQDQRIGVAGTPWKTLEGKAASWKEALQLARRALQRGDLYQAVWISHRLLLGVMDERGLLQFARWKTNRDYLKECRQKGQGYRLLQDLSEAYDQIVYAHRPAAQGRLQGLLNQVDEFYRQS
ncbi:MAG TPA: DUF4129 domain-containing protein [Acidobacteriota bacterium]|nr:DUF4129 domain-containing protein [Acidobacteriota bacterium]